ncbi:hypothetical protein TcCL_NonESM03358 [Trypanosoma cruzi]|nr:hypothetical protein TcCL_NonESM03358 [Trypanosoma cruzi]
MKMTESLEIIKYLQASGNENNMRKKNQRRKKQGNLKTLRTFVPINPTARQRAPSAAPPVPCRHLAGMRKRNPVTVHGSRGEAAAAEHDVTRRECILFGDGCEEDVPTLKPLVPARQGSSTMELLATVVAAVCPFSSVRGHRRWQDRPLLPASSRRKRPTDQRREVT